MSNIKIENSGRSLKNIHETELTIDNPQLVKINYSGIPQSR